MARSIQYWYDYMIQEKNTMSSLNALQPNIDNSQNLLKDLNTPSKVAVWRLMFWCVAACAYAVDVIYDLTVASFSAIAERSRFGTLPWYQKISLQYQHGDALVWLNEDWQYATVNEAAQIVKRVAAIEVEDVNGIKRVLIKAAQLTAGLPAAITTELPAFDEYIQRRRPAGVIVDVISDNPDDLRLYMKVYFDALILDSTGELISSPGTKPVEDAVNNYIANLNNDFNGSFEIVDLVDQIQKVPGVRSIYVTQASAKYGVQPFTNIDERYTAYAGYMKIDATPGFTLADTITYIKANV